MALEAPVALFVWNRPELTREVFERVRDARPRRLLIVADAAREDVPGDEDRCREVREVVADVDWPCQVDRDYADVHMGCRRRMSSGIDWVFEQVPEALILEDDCIPADSFFSFCAEILARYRNVNEVMSIAGTAAFDIPDVEGASYSFSRYNPTWGWATWRRAWKHYDVSIPRWRRIDQSALLSSISPSLAFRLTWTRVFKDAHRDDYDTWDHQWTFTIWDQGGVAVLPSQNLVTNRGFGPDATHTKQDIGFGHRPRRELDFPLRHPPAVEVDPFRERAIWQQILATVILPTPR